MTTDLTPAEPDAGTLDLPAHTADEPRRAIPTVALWRMPLHALTLEQCVDQILARATRHQGGWVVTPNLDILRRYVRSETFRALVASSTFNVADGVPILWASRIKGRPLPERINGTDLMCRLTRAAAAKGLSVYFLGGNPGTAEKAARVFQREIPDLRVAGWDCPPYGFESDCEQLAAIRDRLAAAQPDIVFVGLGSPKQDVVIGSLRLSLPSTWWLGVGVSFSFVSGEIPRAPLWAQRHGLEWLFRLASEPRRLAKRYLVRGIPFCASTLFLAFWERFAAGGGEVSPR